MPVALLFDLDETLVLEEPAAVAAFEATARTAPGIDAARLAVDGRGALACGLRAVWINRFGSGPGRDGVPEIASLAELPAVLYDA